MKKRVIMSCPTGCFYDDTEYTANKQGWRKCPFCGKELVDKETLIYCKQCEVTVIDGEPSQCKHTLDMYVRYVKRWDGEVI
jgi:hypothetical protein